MARMAFSWRLQILISLEKCLTLIIKSLTLKLLTLRMIIILSKSRKWIISMFSKQQSSKKYERSWSNERINDQDASEILLSSKTKTKEAKKTSKKSSQVLENKINIALSDSNKSQNFECVFETGPISEVAISYNSSRKNLQWVLFPFFKI